jgi:hypothetical protein
MLPGNFFRCMVAEGEQRTVSETSPLARGERDVSRIGRAEDRSTKTADGIMCAVVVKLADGKHWRMAAAYKDGIASNQNDAARLQQLRAKNPVADPA